MSNFNSKLISEEKIKEIRTKIESVIWDNNESKITGASLLLTEDCNLNCVYCFENNNRVKNYMSPEVAISAVEYLIKGAKVENRKDFSFTFFGGEPTLNIPIMNLVFDYATYRAKEEEMNCGFSIITNGTIFNQELKDFYKKWKDSGSYVNVQISMDGPADIQDVNRPFIGGAPSSPVVEKNVKEYLKYFKEIGIPPYSLHVHSVLNRTSIGRMYENYRYFLDLGFEKIWFMPCHEEPWEDEDIETYRIEKQKIADYIYEKCLEENNANFLGSYSSLERCNIQHPQKTCGIGFNYASITAEGLVYPCHSVYFNDREMVIGNVLEGIDDIEARRFFLDYTSANVFGDMPCNECDNYTCYRCLAQNYVNNGNFLIGFPQYCKLSRVEDEIRQELRRKLIEKGFLKEQNNSCSCGGECSCGSEDKGAVDRKATLEILKALDQKLAFIEENFIALNNKVEGLIEINNILSESLINLLSLGNENE